VVLAQNLVTIYDQILTQLSGLESANKLRWQAGDISETELQRSELEVQKAVTDVEQAHLTLASERQQLAQILSHGIDWRTLELEDHFPKVVLPEHSEQEWIKQALLQRADYAATELSIQQKQTDVQSAEALKIPDITLGAQYQHNTTAVIPDSFGLGVSVSVPLWHQYQGEVNKAVADKRAAFVARQQLGVQIKTQVSIALAQVKQKQLVLKRFDDTLLTKAKQVSNASSLAYRQGAISLLELLDAERNYRNTLLEYNQAGFDLTSAWLDLMYAIGQDGQL
jgi:cobalt-zinc-cadmium efflux system outer membrane protein